MVSHSKENYTVREECRQRTRLELLCYIGNAYFSQIVLVSGPTKSPLALHTQNQTDRPPMRPGTHVQASLLVTSTNHVKAQDIIIHPNNKHIDITKLLADLHKLKRGEKLKTPVRVEPTTTEKVEKENQAVANNNFRGGSRGELKEEAQQGHDDDEEEHDPEVLARREKQLDTFKRSIDYRYVPLRHIYVVYHVVRIVPSCMKSLLNTTCIKHIISGPIWSQCRRNGDQEGCQPLQRRRESSVVEPGTGLLDSGS